MYESLQSSTDSKRAPWFEKCWIKKRDIILALMDINDLCFTFFKNSGLNSSRPDFIIFPYFAFFFLHVYLRDLLFISVTILFMDIQIVIGIERGIIIQAAAMPEKARAPYLAQETNSGFSSYSLRYYFSATQDQALFCVLFCFVSYASVYTDAVSCHPFYCKALSEKSPAFFCNIL